MSALQLLQTLCEKHPFKSFKELEPNKHYMVRYFSIADSKLGKRIRIDLDDCYMFLPERFVKILSGTLIEELNLSGPIKMVYEGKDETCMNRLKLDFVPATAAEAAAKATTPAPNVNNSNTPMGNMDFNAMEYYNGFSRN